MNGKKTHTHPVPSTKIKVPTTLFVEAMALEHSKEWLKTMELELESIWCNDVAVLTPVSDVLEIKRLEL